MSDPVQINEQFFQQLYHHPAVMGLCAQAASRIARQWYSDAPKDSGAYARSIHVERGQRSGRAVYLVVADDPKAMILEAEGGYGARATRKAGRG